MSGCTICVLPREVVLVLQFTPGRRGAEDMSLSCRFICSKFCSICLFIFGCQRYVLLVENRFQGS